MIWLLPALLAPAFWAMSNMIDEALMKRIMRDPIGLMVVTGLFSGVAVLVLALTGNMRFLSVPETALALATGVVGLSILYPYLRALSFSTASTIVPLWNLSPVFVMILAAVFLHEQLRPLDYVGILLLVLGAFVAAYHGPGKFQWKPLLYMTTATLLVAVESVFEKATYVHASFEEGFGWISLGGFLTAMILLIIRPKTRAALQQNLVPSVVFINVTNETINLAAYALTNFAVSLGAVSLVRAVGGIQAIYILLFSFLLTKIKKQSGQGLSRVVVFRVILSVLFAVAGLALIQTGA